MGGCNATTQTVTLPTHVAGDMLIVRTIRKPFTSPNNTVINTAGWTAVATGVANGSTANGVGVGSMGFKAFYKIATSAAETNPVVTWGTTSAPGAAVAVTYQRGAPRRGSRRPAPAAAMRPRDLANQHDRLATSRSCPATSLTSSGAGRRRGGADRSDDHPDRRHVQHGDGVPGDSILDGQGQRHRRRRRLSDRDSGPVRGRRSSPARRRHRRSTARG